MLFNATRLVTFVFDELTRFFAHKYVSERRATPAEVSMSDVDFVASVAVGFREYLLKLKQSEDHWIATCGCFMEMAHDFLAFVDAYRIGDLVFVEAGYQKHAPIWKILGQSKYVKIFLRQ